MNYFRRETRRVLLVCAAALLSMPGSAAATVTHYFYDAVGRVTGVTAENSQVKAYNYDLNDNRTTYQLDWPSTAPSSSQSLGSTQWIFQTQYLTSANGQYVLSFQEDGNLVLYHGSNAIWSTGTSLVPGASLVMQGDGNLVLYNPQRAAIWSTGTSVAGAYFVIQTDGNLVVYAPNGTALWASNTSGR